YPIPCLPLCPTQTPRPSSDAIPPATRRWLTHSRRGSNRRWRAGARVGWMAKEGMMAELVALEGVRAGVQNCSPSVQPSLSQDYVTVDLPLILKTAVHCHSQEVVTTLD
ncbi:hypothetical protein O3P69_007847, partial [Scylla paramamosain]